MKMDKKKLLILIIAAVLICALMAALLAWQPWTAKKGENGTSSVASQAANATVSQTVRDTGSQPASGIAVSLEGLHLDAQPPYLTVLWKNEGSEPFSFGREYDILYAEDGKNFVSCATAETMITLEMIGLAPGEEMALDYNLETFDLSKAGTYRFQGSGGVTFDFEI